MIRKKKETSSTAPLSTAQTWEVLGDIEPPQILEEKIFLPFHIAGLHVTSRRQLGG